MHYIHPRIITGYAWAALLTVLSAALLLACAFTAANAQEHPASITILPEHKQFLLGEQCNFTAAVRNTTRYRLNWTLWSHDHGSTSTGTKELGSITPSTQFNVATDGVTSAEEHSGCPKDSCSYHSPCQGTGGIVYLTVRLFTYDGMSCLSSATTAIEIKQPILTVQPSQIILQANSGTVLVTASATNVSKDYKLFVPDGPGYFLDARADETKFDAKHGVMSRQTQLTAHEFNTAGAGPLALKIKLYSPCTGEVTQDTTISLEVVGGHPSQFR